MYNFSTSVTTKIYGTVNFKPDKKIQSIRHTITPSLSVIQILQVLKSIMIPILLMPKEILLNIQDFKEGGYMVLLTKGSDSSSISIRYPKFT